MIAYANYESTERSWGMVSSTVKLKFMAAVKKLRKDEGRMLDDAYDEWEDMVWEAKELCVKYNGDFSGTPDEKVVAFNPDKPERPQAEPSRSADAQAPPPPPPPRRFGKGL